MQRFKTDAIIEASVLIGSLAVVGTAHAFNQHEHRVRLGRAKQEIKSEQKT